MNWHQNTSCCKSLTSSYSMLYWPQVSNPLISKQVLHCCFPINNRDLNTFLNILILYDYSICLHPFTFRRWNRCSKNNFFLRIEFKNMVAWYEELKFWLTTGNFSGENYFDAKQVYCDINNYWKSRNRESTILCK